ncbi:hypothetical protein [Mucilaginibacter ginkgonis]|uniref:Uncharacterized protein n=1 Tax=Mucilaginibacter ginkgonis TaxID=2682091 RepID=A0A6I4HW63_9SPHI|nr:hypothetical protein [Mucilaginibacter ginkgonis]QQL50181.1 hypothetical protein GO620_001635 [Mucilaginibacter ginkgonis]
MVELNEFECEMLDIFLEAFGISDSLTRNQLLVLFGHDEATAFALMQILLREGFIALNGVHGAYDLPERLILKPKGEKFLRSGGFVRQRQSEIKKPVEINSTAVKLQQQNMKLQNDKLSLQTDIRNLQSRIDFSIKLRYFYLIIGLVLMVVAYYIGHKVGMRIASS